MTEISAEGLLGTADQIALFDRGQIEDSLSPSSVAVDAAAKADGAEPGVGVLPPDSEIDEGQLPYGDEDSDQGRMTHHIPNQGRDPRGVGQTPGQVAGSAKLPAAIAEFSPLDRRLIGAAITKPFRIGPSILPARCR